MLSLPPKKECTFTCVTPSAANLSTTNSLRRAVTHRIPRRISLSTMLFSRKSFSHSARRQNGCFRASLILVLNLLVIVLVTAYVNARAVTRQKPSTSNMENSSTFNAMSFNFSRIGAFVDQPAVVDGIHDDVSSPSLVQAHLESPSVLRSRYDWEQIPTPDFCTEIKDFPQPYRKNCSSTTPVSRKIDPDTGAPTCDPSRSMMFSQYGEDYFLYTRHFQHMKKPGIYLDVATNHPIAISNTYFMDRCLGWRGICVEANSKYFEPVHRERSCALVPTCVSERDGETVEFALSGPGSGIISTHRQGNHITENAKFMEKKKCVTVKTQLQRYGVKEVDYFNLDVEGGELNVLKSIDWSTTTIKIISVEISSSSETPIYEFLTGKGFVLVDNEKSINGMPGMPIYPSNKFYAHSSVQFGNP